MHHQGPIQPISRHSSGRSTRERRIVQLFFVVYLLLIFEGALRKWVFPEFHEYIFFARDPLVLYIYYLALQTRRFHLSAHGVALTAFSLLIFFLIAYWAVIDGVSLIVLLYGWRNYFFYIPLALIIGKRLTKEDLRQFVILNMYITIPMAALAFFQFRSPPDSFINKSIQEGGFIFQVIDGVVRTTGTFTFTAGFALYAGSAYALALGCWITQKSSLRLSRSLLAISTIASLLLTVISGSRTALILSILINLAAVIAGIAVRRTEIKLKALIAPILTVLAAFIFLTVVFDDAGRAMQERQANAVAEEGSTLGRALSSLYQFGGVFEETPLLGYGIGYGTNGGTASDTGSAYFRLAEDEWTRIVLELGPLLSLIYIGWRIAFFIYLFQISWRSARRGIVFPMILFGFIGPTILNGPMTMQGTINGYAWVFAGLVIAFSRTAGFWRGAGLGVQRWRAVS